MGAPILLLLPLICAVGEAQQSRNAIRSYYIAAVEIGWDYVYLDDGESASDQRRRSNDIPQKYIKAVYREFTDSTYTVPKPRPAWAGIQGPVIHGQAGGKVVVHFKNLASQPYSISPVGVTYWKQSEGAGYDDATAGQEKEDDSVPPGGYYEYVWDISPKDSPTTGDPECLTYSYSSHVDTVRDTNSGLIGPLLICKPSAFTEDGQRRNTAFVLLFAVFDETKSWYGEIGERKSRDKFKKSGGRKEYHTINGYINSTLPGLTMCQGRNHVFWHLIGTGTAPEIHSIQFQDHTLQVMSHRKVTLEMTPMTFTTAEMRPSTPGRFLISCQIHAHRNAGMSAFFTVEDCPEPVTLPGPDLRNVNHKDEDYTDYADMFEIVQPNRPQLQIRSSRGQQSTRVHYIAAEEITWDYAPHLKPTDSELQSHYFRASPHRLGYQYKKVVYVEYTDDTFTQRKNTETTLLGPLLKGEINDQFHIIFKNLASRPFNIYPNGLTKIYPLQRSADVAERNLRTMGVPPNGTFGYVWRLTADDGPLEEDPKCLTQLYQSTVSPERDLASGLVGTLLICKYEAIDIRGRLFSADHRWNLTFAVFDENRSWYINENIQDYSQDPSKVNPSDPDFYNSNVIYSVNGIMFGGRQFVVCQSDVTFWHVANVGTQSDFLSIYFTGNLFQHDDVFQSVLTLFPMTGETVAMETELMGEWEISAFDGSLKSRGMSIRYTVLPCDNGDLPLVDTEDDEEDLSYYLDELDQPGPRSRRSQNRTVKVRLCKKRFPYYNATQSVNTTDNVTNVSVVTGAEEEELVCEVRNVTMTSSGGDNGTMASEGEIPQDILEELERDGDWTASVAQDEVGPAEQGGRRQRREMEGDWREGDVDSGEVENGGEAVKNRTDTGAKMKAEGRGEIASEKNETKADLEESNEILPNYNPLLNNRDSTLEPSNSQELDQNLVPENNIQSDPEIQTVDPLDLDYYNHTNDNETERIALSLDYDNYNQEEDSTSNMFGTDYIDPRSGGNNYHHYYIAAEETTWDYGISLPHQLIKPREMRRGMRKFLPQYKKVVFRAYMDKDFLRPVARGELQQHLGIMGPAIRAEVNNILTVTFKNKASRPYSFHLQGVYDRSQAAGFAQTHASSAPAGVPGEAVPPGEARLYNWRITKTQGPGNNEFNCTAGAYYSTVDKERDLHSGLIGPLIICRPGTLQTRLNLQPGIQEYSLLFHTFDETKSWYLEENLQQYCVPPCQANPDDPWFQISNKFAAINGHVAETLPGLLVAQHQPVRWHLLNVGSDGEYHAVHFHGLSFSVHTKQEHRMGIYNLYPGVFGTMEMRPPTVGTWLVECTIGEYQLAGMRAKLLVYNPRCDLPLGMKSGRIADSQITASDHIGGWEARLARLDQSGYINAWMGRNKMSWIQVDLEKPMLLHGIQTQGVRAALRDNYITYFTISYSLDLETWRSYKGNSTRTAYIFFGNLDGSKVKDNRFSPPLMARYIRIQPLNSMRNPALRMELLGCDLNSCSLPLGLRRRLIPDKSFNASSFHSSLLRTWRPSLARLHQEGRANAWRPKNNNPHEWLQVDLLKVRRITGVVTQGARALLTQMMVTEFSVTVSYDGHSWSSVLEDESNREKIFTGNNDPDEEAVTLFDPPLFGQFLRIHPRGWINDIALRLEVLGCDTQPSTS